MPSKPHSPEPSTSQPRKGGSTSSNGYSPKSSGAVGKPPVLVTTRAYREHAELLDLLHVLGTKIGHAAGTDRKMTQLSRVLSALTSATMFDKSPLVLEHPDRWALRYLESGKAPEVRARPRTLKEHARRMRKALDDMKATRPAPSRTAVAAWLADGIESALARDLYAKLKPLTMEGLAEMRAKLVADITERLPDKAMLMALGRAGGKADQVSASKDFAEDTELTIVAAFKAGRLPRETADQLFKARR
jgi:hypothetical protein